MTISVKIILFLLIAWFFVAGLYVVGLILTLVYIFFFNGPEIVFLSILLDGYYQHFYSIPLFSLLALIGYLSMKFLKPFLLMYNNSNDLV